jgi:hypothetical protein
MVFESLCARQGDGGGREPGVLQMLYNDGHDIDIRK